MKITRFTEIISEAKTQRRMSPKKNIKVIIDDKEFYNPEASKTFYDVIDYIVRKIGVETFLNRLKTITTRRNIVALNIDDFPDYVSKGSIKKSLVGDFYITSHSSTEEKHEILRELIEGLELNGKIEIIEGKRQLEPSKRPLDTDNEQEFEMDKMVGDVDEIEIEKIPKLKQILSEFWTYFLSQINSYTDIFLGRTKGKEHWLTGTTGIRNIHFNPTITSKYASIELCLNREKEENKKIFDWLYTHKEKIETDFGFPLEWNRLDDKKVSLIKFRIAPINSYDKSNWPKVMQFFTTNFPRFEKTFDPFLEKIDDIKKLKDFEKSETKEKREFKPESNPFKQSYCVLGKSGFGKSQTVSNILENEKHEFILLIPTSLSVSLLGNYSSKGGGSIIPTRLANLILEAYENPSNLYTAVIDECHKPRTIEMVNDELLQAISKDRNSGNRFLTIEGDVYDLMIERISKLEIQQKDYLFRRNIRIPDNFGFIFLSSKPDVIVDNDDFYNRVDIINLPHYTMTGKDMKTIDDLLDFKVKDKSKFAEDTKNAE